MSTREERAIRLRRANILIWRISLRGRRFFSGRGGRSRFEMDARGRLWWIDHTGRRGSMHVHRTSIRGFSGGGTLMALAQALKRYIWDGEQLNPRYFGPWPSWVADGDLWGYGAEGMADIRRLAAQLGITREEADGRRAERAPAGGGRHE